MITISLAMAIPFVFVGVPILFIPFLAAVFYVLIKQVNMENSFVIPGFAILLMRLSVGIVFLWMVAKIYAMFIPGGGASYAANYYGMYTLIPAASLILILDFVVLLKSYGKGVVIITTVVFLSAVTIRLLALPYLDKLSGEERWNEQCKNAVDNYDLKNETIERIEFFNFVSQEQYSMGKSKEFTRKRGGREYFGLELIKRGIIDEYEVFARGNPAQYVSRIANDEQIRTPINKSVASHRVFYKSNKIANGEKWFIQYVITIINKKSGKEIAKRVQLIDPFKGGRSCAQVYDDRISTTDFIEKAIKISRE